MSESAVDDILKLIDNLSATEREALGRRLFERAEAEWRQEVEAARMEAKARGIDQAAIDEAVRKLRHASRDGIPTYRPMRSMLRRLR